MKKLLFALAFAVLGTGAYAKDLRLPVAKPNSANIVVKNLPQPNKVEIGKIANEQLGLFRRQMNFTFTDACGAQTTIYVSGASSASNHSLWQFAWDYFKDNLITGCFWVG
ncbi:hypothetical protein SRABI27_02372 [Pedobacter sp. Bi27]|uniref:hypothetical protein n=1 Tax=unclassified Pedobacter TaxID=2628915 RepID=UPI001E0A8897|nr:MULTISPECIES: hypothetical protein [unclassified Pedobacter]CAH0226907.1 hypothetical protein SRABI27_02372 [Pedobacter sp. Bi27]CAH0240061.1 hypothetical protein SRABI36_02944 [Pedobacter sp. Bi36]CAH0266149.1 hypothetical protein SRABI126_03344 [Pedobacter sp. Bi126]